MKKATLIFVILLQLAMLTPLSAQQKAVNLLDSARVYYEKKDFKKSFEFYEVYHANPTQGTNNLDTYFAAVTACHAGNIERAKFYLKWSASIGYDIPDYKKYEMDEASACMKDLPEWQSYIKVFKLKSDSLVAMLTKTTNELNDTTNRINNTILLNDTYWKNIASKSSAHQLTNKIKHFNEYPVTKKDNFWTLYNIKVNDTLTIPFLVHIPKNYNAKKRTSLYVYLHGAVANRPKFANPAYIPTSLEATIMTKGMQQEAFIIYPFGRKDFAWLYQQQAFETILQEISHVKSLYNIDDNKVYIGGHSNGGSGAFWFAVNKPSTFSAFFGLNYYPKVYSSNTSLRNLRNNTPFYGISGSEDRAFPISTVNAIYNYGTNNGSNWKNFTKKGDHGLPFSNRDSINFIFDTLATKIRDPFPKKIEWETDNVKNGRNAWLEILELDTLTEKANWHTLLNPTITQNGKSAFIDFNKNKSGAVKASVEGNTIKIESSRVKRIKLYISEDMFDLNQQIKIVINSKDYINLKLSADKNVILEEFLKTKDRAFIVANKIEFTIK